MGSRLSPMMKLYMKHTPSLFWHMEQTLESQKSMQIKGHKIFYRLLRNQQEVQPDTRIFSTILSQKHYQNS